MAASLFTRAVVTTLLLGSGCAAAARAEPASPDTSAAFTTLALGLEAAAPLSCSGLGDAWTARPGIGAAAATPFYAGVVHVGARRLPFSADRPDVAAFVGWHLYAGWSVAVELAGALRVEAGGRLGVLQMRFDDEQTHVNQRTEQEVQADATAALAWRLAPHWHVRLSAAYGTLFLSTPVHPAHVALGLHHTFTAPRWLRDVLR